MTAPYYRSDAAARELDAWLDKVLGGAAQAAATLAALDRDEEFPAEVLDRLDEFGLADFYVPAELGGRLDDHEELLHLWRTVARRDLTPMVAHGKTYLGSATVWAAGSPEQARALAGAVRAGTRVSWGLSEPDHGADLLGGELTATRTADGYRLDGVKWPVNNATRGGAMTVLARTGEAGDARGYSLLLVDKDTLPPGSFRTLPKALTHGIRGVDISGIAFDGAVVPAGALVGSEGGGAETVLRTLQLTRTMCAALSLGAGEHALRITTGFVAERVIQNRPLADRPHVRAVIARCAALLAATEAAALLGVRSAHSLTDEHSVASAVVKGLAPTLVDGVVGELAELLGSRSFLTVEYAEGEFQKVWRDHQIVAVFDGSTPVNRNALAHQFPRLVRGFVAGTADAEGLAEAAEAGRRPRPLDRSRLALLSRRGCSPVQDLPALATALAEERQAPAALVAQAEALVDAADRLHAMLSEVRPAAHPEAAVYELAAGYELLYAGAAVLRLWRSGAEQHAAEPLWQDALWARAALRELLPRLHRVLGLGPAAPADDHDLVTDLLADRILAATAAGAPVTPFGTPLATYPTEEDS
jgi:alkylation response protein AidB-like acyl-CoA dehydrogenase